MVERGERAHRDVESLQRLDASDEQEHRMGRRGPSAVRATLAMTGREERVVDTWRRDLDPTRRRAVEAFELRSFLGAAPGSRRSNP